MSTSTFAADFRKRKSCNRCKRLKVKCAWESPDSVACNRCEKAQVSCVTNDAVQPFGAGAAKGSGGVQKRYGSTSTSPSTKEKSTIDDLLFMSKDLLRGNYVHNAIQLGLLDSAKAERLYNRFIEELYVFVYFEVDKNKSFEEMAEKNPLMCLGMICAVGWCSRELPMLEKLSEYFERSLVEKLFFEAKPDPELLNCMYVTLIFFQQSPDQKMMIEVLIMFAVTIGQDLGSKRDVQILLNGISGDITEQEYQFAKDRCIAFIGVYSTVSITTQHIAKINLLRKIPFVEEVEDAIMKCGNSTSTMLIRLLKLWRASEQAVDEVADLSDNQQIRQKLEHYRVLYDQGIQEVIDMCPEDTKQRGGLAPFTTNYLQISLALEETAMNRIVFGTQGLDSQLFTDSANRVVTIAWKLVTAFTQQLSSTTLLPKFMYFRPLHALCALIRIRIFSFMCGPNVETSIERAYDVVSSSWIGACRGSHEAEILYPHLQKVQQFITLKLQNPVPDSDTNDTARWMLRNILMGALLHNPDDSEPLPESKFGLSDFVQGPGQLSDADMEALMKELFSEIA